MRIYAMTATFGKLEHQTLTFTQGLNIIEAPNEWGKSTWCAFLVNMLYGIDTRARTTGTMIADKERYAPWSGSAMSGRIDLCWNGRDITIERRTKGRVIFGDFRAYETQTGMDVPELNSANCGQQLLGVERSVFTRAGFLKQSDLPVTQDDALRRRLNNLVTTGDESGAGDQLAEQLKNLKNKCRHNRTGLLPQAETERDQMKKQLEDLHDLRQQAELIQNAQHQLEEFIDKLENHAAALRYEACLDDLRKVEAAEQAAQDAKERLASTMEICRQLPPQEELQRKLHLAKTLQEQWLALQMESQMLPPLPEQPEIPETARDVAGAEADAKAYQLLVASKKKNAWILGGFCTLSAVLILCAVMMPSLATYMALAASVMLVLGNGIRYIRTKKINAQIQNLSDHHPGITPDNWVENARKMAEKWEEYQLLLTNATALRENLQQRTNALQEKMDDLTDALPLAQRQQEWTEDAAAWEELSDARRELQRCQTLSQTLRSMLRTPEPAQKEDTLSYTQEETERLLTEARLKQRQLHTRLGQCQGQAEALGSESLMKARIDTLNRRIARLEDTYYALEMAQDALRDATNTLQRRFAPRISKRTQELFSKLTDGRYSRLSLGNDLSISASAQQEDTLRSAQWRSDGTVDQLYLALRLAVAEELTPDAPLILDDAFVRFDDTRLKAALEILKEESEKKQVIVFTCQSREKEMEETV